MLGTYSYTGALDSNGLLNAVFGDIHTFMLYFALVFILFGLYRNIHKMHDGYLQEGINWLVGTLVIILCIWYMPEHILQPFETSMNNWAHQYSDEMHRVLYNLKNVEVAGSWPWDKLGAFFSNAMIKMSAGIADMVRGALYMFVGFIFQSCLALSPLFFAFLTVPELRSAGINFCMILLGIIILPVCYLLADIFCIKFLVWALGYAGVLAGANTGGTVATALISSSGVSVFPAVGMALVSFIVAYCIIIVVINVGIPIAFIKLLRSGSISSTLGQTMNTASNVSSAIKSSASSGGGLARQIQSSIKKD